MHIVRRRSHDRRPWYLQHTLFISDNKKKTAGRALCYSNGRIALPVHFIRAELRLGFTEYTYFIIFIIRTLTV